MDLKKFLGVFWGFYSEETPGAPGAWRPGCRDPGQLGLVLLWEFGSLQGVWEFGFVSCAPGAGRPAPGSYPQVIHMFFYIREFGSLKALDKNRDP